MTADGHLTRSAVTVGGPTHHTGGCVAAHTMRPVIAARGSGPSQGVGCKSYGVLVPVPAPTQYGGGAGVMH